MNEHYRHIFLEQVYQNDKMIQRLMYSKDGTLIHDYVDDEDLKNSFTNQQLYFFSQQFFDENYRVIQRYNNRFFDELFKCNDDDINYNENGLVDSFKSILYDTIYVENDEFGFPVRVYDKNMNFFQIYRYDENYNLVYVNDNDRDIYKFQYVFYEDIYNLLNVQLIEV